MVFIIDKDICTMFNKMCFSTLTNYDLILCKYGINEEMEKINITISLTIKIINTNFKLMWLNTIWCVNRLFPWLAGLNFRQLTILQNCLFLKLHCMLCVWHNMSIFLIEYSNLGIKSWCRQITFLSLLA